MTRRSRPQIAARRWSARESILTVAVAAALLVFRPFDGLRDVVRNSVPMPAASAVLSPPISAANIAQLAIEHTFSVDDRLYQIVVSPDGQFLAAETDQREVLLLRTADGTLLQRLTISADRFYDLTVTPDSRTVITVSDRAIEHWSVADGSRLSALPIQHPNPPFGVEFSSDAALLLIYGETVAIYRTSDAELVREFSGTLHFMGAQISADGELLITNEGILGGNSGYGGTSELALRRIDDGHVFTPLIQRGFESPDIVTTLAFSPDGRLLALGKATGAIELWDIPSWRRLRTLKGPPGYLAQLQFGPDSSLLFAVNWIYAAERNQADDVLLVWQSTDDTLLHALGGFTSLPSFALSPDGRTLYTAHYDAETDRTLLQFRRIAPAP